MSATAGLLVQYYDDLINCTVSYDFCYSCKVLTRPMTFVCCYIPRNHANTLKLLLMTSVKSYNGFPLPPAAYRPDDFIGILTAYSTMAYLHQSGLLCDS